jgi:ribosome-associated translation inhibitor RaiA
VTDLLIEQNSEVKSFIYQQIVDLQPYLTPTSRVSVTSQIDEADYLAGLPPKVHHILISIQEDGARLEEEGSSENIFEAILEAKNKLLKKLGSIQDSVISQKDRLAQIRHFRTRTHRH